MNEIAKFAIQYTGFLDPEGNVQQNLPEFTHHVHELLTLYQQMLLIRLFDEKAIALQRTGRLNTYASILGQEAISVGIGASMHKEDVLCPFYRDYGAQLMRGVKMSEILSFWKGNEWANHFSECYFDFPICVPIATQLLHAAGVATAFKLRKQKRVVVTTCGDGATSEGDFYEALNIAGVWKLPLVIVINNNQWAISMPRKKQSHAQTLAQKAIAAGIQGEQIDGNDLIAVKWVMDRALAKAREGQGPSLIEALSYRLSDHTTADDSSRYRREEELHDAWQKEPLKRLKNYLMNQKMWSDAAEEKFKKECKEHIENAVTDYLSLPKPAVTDMFDYHYAQLSQDLIEQRVEAEALLMLLNKDRVNV
ncbi:pyruvate dehydrogenase (acetyl-transferring) E1 component subunit alpha [Rickettsiella grylli]|uniref:Pyruvate dehydrogenase E1 component subunit alpha n=1 Tax=Rickettsiella grylli TaxID=59196 RepID=A8PL08_9COXI|nr:pyruvate dehydrogenase (acetyl-transferring) E1 component subunit alpha [Rickettsiella grylli]EDP46988.1 pyruvate dehydrogenase (acetyl-transferring) E1 component, alpha subunit [Rickettsiella grylli]